MSQENVEIALAAAATFNRGDQEAFIALWDEEAEFVPLRAQLEREAYRGYEGLERFFTKQAEQWGDSVRSEINESRAVGDEVVVGIGRFRARGRASGSISTSRLAYSCSPGSCSPDRVEQARAGFLATPAGLGADPAVLVMLGVALALLGAR
jgi:ketosteroid isomerase-like protein